jgi:hypothetical protein
MLGYCKTVTRSRDEPIVAYARQPKQHRIFPL